MEKIKVIKIGGALIENGSILEELCDELTKQTPFVLVHGGGKLAASLAGRLDIPVQMIDGRRVTDAATLEVAVMCYAGWANKLMVSQLQKRRVNACGISGCDSGVVRSVRRASDTIDWGFVGDVTGVSTQPLLEMLANGTVPVISPITMSDSYELLNSNADGVAAAVAKALSATHKVELVYCFDKPGVLEDVNNEESVIAQLNYSDYVELKATGAIHSGMLPKLENAFSTLAEGVNSVRLTSHTHLNKGTVIKMN
ncbi:MAG: acetylglutamate kinase [Marinifilaceae bacterium]